MEREPNKTESLRQPVQSEIFVICGPMFSSKSSTLIGMISPMPYAGLRVIAFKPDTDTRRGKNTINTEDGLKFPAVSVKTSLDILKYLRKKDFAYDVVAIDEAQFFDMDLPDVCEELAIQRKRVIVAGLDKDFRGEAFGPMGILKDIADNILTKHAYCACCQRRAFRTQRIIIGEDGVRRPANYNDPIVLVGAKDAYEARCRECHQVPGKPENRLNEEIKGGEIKFLLTGSGEAVEQAEHILRSMKFSVYRPPDKNTKDIDLQTDEERYELRRCQAAIFGPGRNWGISQVRDWSRTGKPSLLLLENIEADSWLATSKALYTQVNGFKNTTELKQSLRNFSNGVRIQYRRERVLRS